MTLVTSGQDDVTVDDYDDVNDDDNKINLQVSGRC